MQEHIGELAKDTDVMHIPSHTPVKPNALRKALEDFEEVKGCLAEGDKAAMVVSSGEEAWFDLSSRLDIDAIEQLATRETEIHTVPRMVLVVKKSDYLGDSMWEFRHGKKSLEAKIEDAQWLQEFRDRQVTIRSGDALGCRIRIEISYGHDNEVVSEKHYVEKVLELLEAHYPQTPDLFPDLGSDSP